MGTSVSFDRFVLFLLLFRRNNFWQERVMHPTWWWWERRATVNIWGGGGGNRFDALVFTFGQFFFLLQVKQIIQYVIAEERLWLGFQDLFKCFGLCLQLSVAKATLFQTSFGGVIVKKRSSVSEVVFQWITSLLVYSLCFSQGSACSTGCCCWCVVGPTPATPWRFSACLFSCRRRAAICCWARQTWACSLPAYSWVSPDHFIHWC